MSSGRQRCGHALWATFAAVGLSACGVSGIGNPHISDGPGTHVVCDGSVEATCANRAADLTRHLTAWIPVNGQGPSTQFAVLGGRYAVQNLKSGSADVQVQSPPLEQLRSSKPGSRISFGTDSGDLVIERNQSVDDLLEIRWSHRGEPFKVTIVGPGLDANAAIALMRGIRYSEPASNRSH